ncbi:hypothetical protein GCK32_000324 [Trichostrongylus colubriformis]|uniref:Uncharacterized protein n=1 Tax=Trichostrongylus colubriformis TaxID=6319 RepID=A0AAN8F170_TRICO
MFNDVQNNRYEDRDVAGIPENPVDLRQYTIDPTTRERHRPVLYQVVSTEWGTGVVAPGLSRNHAFREQRFWTAICVLLARGLLLAGNPKYASRSDLRDPLQEAHSQRYSCIVEGGVRRSPRRRHINAIDMRVRLEPRQRG